MIEVNQAYVEDEIAVDRDSSGGTFRSFVGGLIGDINPPMVAFMHQLQCCAEAIYRTVGHHLYW